MARGILVSDSKLAPVVGLSHKRWGRERKSRVSAAEQGWTCMIGSSEQIVRNKNNQMNQQINPISAEGFQGKIDGC